jgi:ABC-type transport system involved in cytochrome bd biosynthesis fused ATPase/permease subunit
MVSAQDFQITQSHFAFRQDQYQLNKIKRVRVKANTLKDHALRMLCIGLVVSSVVWMVCPESFGMLTAPVAFTAGIITALGSTRKYELQIEFQHIDETGLQWVSVAKSNNQQVKSVFEEQVMKVHASLEK